MTTVRRLIPNTIPGQRNVTQLKLQDNFNKTFQMISKVAQQVDPDLRVERIYNTQIISISGMNLSNNIQLKIVNKDSTHLGNPNSYEYNSFEPIQYGNFTIQNTQEQTFRDYLTGIIQHQSHSIMPLDLGAALLEAMPS